MKLDVKLEKNTYRANENVVGKIEFSQPLIGDIKGFKLIAKGEEKTEIDETQQVFVPVEGQDKDGHGFPDPPDSNTSGQRTHMQRIEKTVTWEESDVFFRKEVELPSLASPAVFEFTLPPD